MTRPAAAISGLELMMITGDPEVAKSVEAAGVDIVFVDLEIRGKAERQAGRNTVISRHTAQDAVLVREALTTASLLVRINPWWQGSEVELEAVFAASPDIVMLPYFRREAEVESFLRAMEGTGARACLLFETPESVALADKILSMEGINMAFVGLNDLHVSMGKSFMFELLTDGTVESLCARFAKAGVRYGFGGVARIGSLVPPAECILAEHFRLGSSMVILSRSFCDPSAVSDRAVLQADLSQGVGEIRKFESWVSGQDDAYFEANRLRVSADVARVVAAMTAKLGAADSQ